LAHHRLRGGMRSTPIPPEGRPTDDTRESVCRLRWERTGPSAREFAQKSSLSESSRDHLVAKEIILHRCPTSFSRPLKGVDTAAVHDDNILIGEALSDSRARNTDFSRAGRAAVSFTKTRVVFFQLEITTTVSSESREANEMVSTLLATSEVSRISFLPRAVRAIPRDLRAARTRLSLGNARSVLRPRRPWRRPCPSPSPPIAGRPPR